MTSDHGSWRSAAGSKLLSQPLTFSSGLTLRNRLAKAAMSENMADGAGGTSERLIRLYERLGRGGAGLLVTGNVVVDPDGRTERDNVVTTRASMRSLVAWARAAKSGGAAVIMQLNHAGRQTSRTITWDPVAPSAPRLRRQPGMFSTPRLLSTRQIKTLISRFAEGAAMSKAAGFDGVEIHGSHGYLISQFLSPLANKRTDDYGGDLQGRMRFLLQVVRGAKATLMDSPCVKPPRSKSAMQRALSPRRSDAGVERRSA